MSELRIGVVGRGRVGTAISEALRAAGRDVAGPLGRGETPANVDAVLLCVPDAEIPAAAAAVGRAASLVGHTSGATRLAALEPSGARGLFGLHPLQTFTGSPHDAERFHGCRCAVGGTSDEALDAALGIARTLGMEPFELSDEQRPAYHAAASIASNFLVALEAAAEEVAAGAGLDPAEARAALAPLVRTTVENWAELGPERALTGPVARGDDLTVAAQREAVRATAPQLEALFDVMVERAQALARQRVPA
ncbi:MAG TPA: DUF2520 domain-containing protein [Thermoleophilaceae bacterium]|nr:DUF2520 domain-containing protein [Thermoleophilaceae bacterium]